jgi:phosphoribosylanthranilate isomerase
MNVPLIKICGNTSLHDAQFAVDSGADYIGVIVDYPPSPRHVSLSAAINIRRSLQGTAQFVAVTVNLSFDELRRLHDALQPDVLQLHGDETPDLIAALQNENIRLWAAVHNAERANQMRDAGVEALLVDARAATAEGTIYGGTGQRSDWLLARSLVQDNRSVVLAGGLDAQNVGEAVEQVGPWMVDVISGVEARKGIKDPQKVAQFINVVRGK